MEMLILNKLWSILYNIDRSEQQYMNMNHSDHTKLFYNTGMHNYFLKPSTST